MIRVLACGMTIMMSFVSGVHQSPASTADVVVILSCQGGSSATADVRSRICEELERQIKAQAPARRVVTADGGGGGDALVVSLEMTEIDTYMIKGRLAWTPAEHDGGRTLGPEVETTSSDRPLTPRAYEQFVRGLLTVSELPL